MLERFTEQQFRERLREICDLALHHASDIPARQDPTTWGRDMRIFFNRKVWEGWKLAQQHIVDELVQISAARADALQHLKEARATRNQRVATAITVFINNLKYQEALLRSVANSLVWTMYALRRWIIRRLWTGSPPVSITSINPTTFQLAGQINDDPDSAAILTDITSLVSIGDIITVNSENLAPQIIEVKDGHVNEYIGSLIAEYGTDSATIPPQIFDKLKSDVGSSGPKHFERVVRQIRRGDNFLSFANDDVGEDPLTGAPMQLVGPIKEHDDYDDVLMEMISSAATTGAAVNHIDACLWIGVYSSASMNADLQTRFLQEIEIAVLQHDSPYGISQNLLRIRPHNLFSYGRCLSIQF